MTRVLNYVEIDVDYCGLIYNQSPCTAELGVTGEKKCFNTLKTCQDRDNFNNLPVTLRFTEDVNYLPADIEALPNIKNIDFSPAVVSLGENLGERANLTITFKDHKHSDAGEGYDKYLSSRNYDPFNQGTYWGKFRARQPFLRGRALRLKRGVVGQAFTDFETRHYIIDSFNGPNSAGIYTIIAKDILKLADDDRSQAPVLSQGFLLSDITDSATSATLAPAGIGDLEYDTSGVVAIGGEELCDFTRSGDTLTLTRGQYNTTAIAHEGQDRVQQALVYTSQDPADIIYDLLKNYAGVSDTYLPLTSWQNETGGFLNRLYGAIIAEPVGVNTLISEIIEQAALSVWWDDLNKQVKLQVLRSIDTSAKELNEDNVIENTYRVSENPDKRVSQVWTYYGRRNSLLPLDETDNYRSVLLSIDAASETDYGSARIKKIFSRWIPALARSTAERVNDIIISRFKDPPRTFSLELFKFADYVPAIGTGHTIKWWTTQDDEGIKTAVPCQPVRLNSRDDKYILQSEELLISKQSFNDLIDRTIIIDSNYENFNLRTVHDSIYPVPIENDSPTVSVTVTVDEGVTVSSANSNDPAFEIGTWPAGVRLILINNGTITGAGGKGGGSGQAFTIPDREGGPGADGGTAVYTRYDLEIDNTNGTIAGGGGGGGGGNLSNGAPTGFGVGGSGGAGTVNGKGGSGSLNTGNAGTATTGGAGVPGVPPHSGNSGAGGDLGQPGNAAPAYGSFGSVAGGAAGSAIDGDSYVTYIDSGTILGPRVN